MRPGHFGVFGILRLPGNTLSDRFQARLFSALAPAVAGIFICALGLAPNFATLARLVFLGGAGIASFHPQAVLPAEWPDLCSCH